MMMNAIIAKLVLRVMIIVVMVVVVGTVLVAMTTLMIVIAAIVARTAAATAIIALRRTAVTAPAGTTCAAGTTVAAPDGAGVPTPRGSAGKRKCEGSDAAQQSKYATSVEVFHGLPPSELHASGIGAYERRPDRPLMADVSDSSAPRDGTKPETAGGGRFGPCLFETRSRAKQRSKNARSRCEDDF
jgi:hypothetical protein